MRGIKSRERTEQPMRLAVCVPARDMVHAAFAFDMTRALVHFVGTTNSKLTLLTSMGTLICNQRQELAKEAIKAGADWILYLDSDMRFPADLIPRLLAHNVDAVAVNYSTRRMPVLPVAFRSNDMDDRAYTSETSTGLEAVAAVGMGAFLVRVEAVKALPMPWFQIGYSRTMNDFLGEDIFFCRLLREAGHTIWIDHDLSKEIAHIGTFEYRNEHALAVAALDAAE